MTAYEFLKSGAVAVYDRESTKKRPQARGKKKSFPQSTLDGAGPVVTFEANKAWYYAMARGVAVVFTILVLLFYNPVMWCPLRWCPLFVATTVGKPFSRGS